MKLRTQSACIATSIVLSCAIVLGTPQQTSVEHPTGVIAGRVVDGDGRPMRGIEVQALAYAYENGKRQMMPHGKTASTNDRGEFRVFWLEPGAYYIAMNVPQVAVIPYTPVQFPGFLRYVPPDPDASYVTTYFPGTSDIQKAETVEIRASEVDVYAIPMVALATRVIHVQIEDPRFAAVGPAPAVNAGPMAVALRPLDDRPYVPVYRWTMPPPVSDGKFEVRAGLAPGSYWLGVEIPMLDGLYVGSAEVAIEQADPKIVDIPISKTASVEGNVQFEGSDDSDQHPASLSIIYSTDVTRSLQIPVSVPVRSNGKFKLENILPMPYAIGIRGLTNDAYLDRIQLQDKVMSPANVKFPPSSESAGITLVVKQDGGRISGIAQPDSTVVVMRPDLFKSVHANKEGQFEIRGVVPGDYTAFMEGFESSATNVTVYAGAQLNVDLTPNSKQ
jgi:hypothetical protein